MKVNKRVYLTCKECKRVQTITWSVDMSKPLSGVFDFVCKDRVRCKWVGRVRGSLTRPKA
jgi:hypothetical protein